MVDILLASYNGEPYIKEQIESIIRQSYKNWRMIIHDDCSKDNTVQIVRDLISEFDKKRENTECMNLARNIKITVNETPYGSAKGNFLGLLKEAQSDYVMFSDQDDIWHPDKIRKSVDRIRRAEKRYGKDTPLLIYTDLVVVDSKLKKISDSFIDYMKVPPKISLPRLLIQNSVTGCTVIMNRALYSLLNKAKDTEKIVMHDHFAALIAGFMGKVLFLPEATIDYRQHGDNSVGASNARSIVYLWKRFKRGKRQFKRDMDMAMVQTEYFYDLYANEISEEKNRELIQKFIMLRKQNKLRRVYYYVKYRVIKYGFIRAVMQLIWG